MNTGYTVILKCNETGAYAASEHFSESLREMSAETLAQRLGGDAFSLIRMLQELWKAGLRQTPEQRRAQLKVVT